MSIKQHICKASVISLIVLSGCTRELPSIENSSQVSSLSESASVSSSIASEPSSESSPAAFENLEESLNSLDEADIFYILLDQLSKQFGNRLSAAEMRGTYELIYGFGSDHKVVVKAPYATFEDDSLYEEWHLVKAEEYKWSDYVSKEATLLAVQEKESNGKYITTLFSTDMGKNWTIARTDIVPQNQAEAQNPATNVYCEDQFTGYLLINGINEDRTIAPGGQLYRTKDSGKTWEKAADIPEQYVVWQIYAYNNTVFLSCFKDHYSFFVKSSDFVHWTETELPLDTETYLFTTTQRMLFIENYGIAEVSADNPDKRLSARLFYFSEDYGDTWRLWEF